MKYMTTATLISAIVLGGILHCTNSKTVQLDSKESCTLNSTVELDSDDQNSFIPNHSMNVQEGTGWIARFDEGWEITRGPEKGTELLAMIEDIGSLSYVRTTISVEDWNTCPVKFMSKSIKSYIVTHDVMPLKDAAVDLGGQTWYIFTFVDEKGQFGMFATTASTEHGFVLDCVTSGESAQESIDICSEFLANVALTDKSKTNKFNSNSHQKTYDL